MKIQTVLVLVLVAVLTGCGSEQRKDTDVSKPNTPEPVEPVLTMVEGKFDWKGENVSGEGFVLSSPKENVFEIEFNTPFTELTESTVSLVDSYGAVVKAIGNERLDIGIAPLDPGPYKVSFRVLGYTIKNPT